MNVASKSDLELLEHMIGKRAALKVRGTRLSVLFGQDAGHPILHIALELVKRLLQEEMEKGEVCTSPANVAHYCKAHFKTYESEAFVALFLDARHRIIEIVEMFRGTLTGAAVYPREIVREALRKNAAALIIAHNHPSGIADPSFADRELTERIRTSLALVDIRLLDHIIVGGSDTLSFAERGWC